MQVHTEQSSQSTEPLKLRDRHVYIIIANCLRSGSGSKGAIGKPFKFTRPEL